MNKILYTIKTFFFINKFQNLKKKIIIQDYFNTLRNKKKFLFIIIYFHFLIFLNIYRYFKIKKN